jgi:anti-anti-sigma regulatory factor
MQQAFWLRVPLLGLGGFAQRAGLQLPARVYAGTPGPVGPRALPQKLPELTGPESAGPEPALRMAVEVLETLKGPIVRLRGEVGIAEASALEASLGRLVARRPACVTFDLSRLVFISSILMGVLASFRRAAVRAGIRVSLAPDLHPGVYEALKRAGVLGLFETVSRATACVEPGAVAEDSRTQYPNVNDVERTFGVTWGQLVELEPQLETLLGRARQAGASCRTFPDVERVFGPVRNELAGLIGFAGKHHSHAVLGSAGAYEVAYWNLYHTVAELVPGRAAPEKDARPCRESLPQE